MISPKWSILVLFMAYWIMAVESNKNEENDALIPFEREKREIDENFEHRYNHLKHEYKQNPGAFTFFKYFLRNRGQKRDRRQINGQYYTNGYDASYNSNNNRYASYNPRYNNNYNAYSRYDQRLRQAPLNSQPQQFIRDKQSVRQRQVSSTTLKPKRKDAPKRGRPFRPPMVFF